jgi:hypothetical protein
LRWPCQPFTCGFIAGRLGGMCGPQPAVLTALVVLNTLLTELELSFVSISSLPACEHFFQALRGTFGTDIIWCNGYVAELLAEDAL